MNVELRFCPLCKGTMDVRDAGHPASPHPTCLECGFVLWLNMKPSVEALIVRGVGPATEVLLGRRAMADGRIAWDIPGGFLNADDRLRPALERECLREVGVEIDILALLGVFEGDFAGTHTASIVYVCRIRSGQPHAADIVDEVAWFPLHATVEAAYPAVAEALDALRLRLHEAGENGSRLTTEQRRR
jgi:ADP-ribose pyrophosphatase YjhB (NUDIX family)